ncbi:MAG: UDP-N-acetylmuramate dehydrogenase [Kiritimatiellaceae bacterium]|nr:UDP-N-acetylmuramate dehydrogenase [Kiritimatiellaceae bacterium]
MKLVSEIQTLFPQLRVTENALLRDITTFRVGGPCPLLIEGAAAAQLPAIIQRLNKTGQPFLVIGQGANLVVSDKGIDQAVIRFCSETPTITADGKRVTVSGDTLLDDLAVFTIENESGDLSYCSGIPGTVGGGIAGNAGAFGRQMGDHLISAEILGLDGRTRTAAKADLEFAYRHSKLKETGEIVLSATFELPIEKKEIMQAERDRIMQFRKDHHPDWHKEPCAGSVFRNIEPTSAVERRKAAGFFLQEAGAHLFRVGGARLYEKHANIIVADPGCTAQDVWELSEKMARAVKNKFDITLVREVRFLGEF